MEESFSSGSVDFFSIAYPLVFVTAPD